MTRIWEPHPYQLDAIEFAIKRDGSGLMLDPGMGKTSVTLAVIDILKSVKEIRKTLVIAPLRVCKTVWKQEGAKWINFNHLKICDLTNLTVQQRSALIAADFDVYLINPESSIKVLEIMGREFDLLVLDESTKYKDTATQRFKALRKRLFDFKRRMILTGTPVPNGLADLFGQMFVVDFGASLGKYVSHFRMEFMHQRPGDLYGWYLNLTAPEMIYKRVESRLMRLAAVDHLDMPVLVNNFIMTDLPAQHRQLYKDLKNDFVAQLEDRAIAVFNPSAVGTKLRQVANGFIYEERPSSDGKGPPIRIATDLHEEKLDALEELLEEMQGRPLLVAYEFDHDRVMLERRFPWAVDLARSGNLQKTMDAFNAGELPMVIAHPASAGHGINLQGACNTLCWYGITWNLEHYQQFIARVWRQGQSASQVIVHHLVCRGTKDEDVMEALDSKDRTQQAFNKAITK